MVVTEVSPPHTATITVAITMAIRTMTRTTIRITRHIARTTDTTTGITPGITTITGITTTTGITITIGTTTGTIDSLLGPRCGSGERVGLSEGAVPTAVSRGWHRIRRA